MSLVGTRPILPDELEQYELHHRARLICSVICNGSNKGISQNPHKHPDCSV